MLDVGCWMLDIGCWMYDLDVGCWMMDVVKMLDLLLVLFLRGRQDL